MKLLLGHFLQCDGTDLVFRDAGKLVKDGVGDPVDGGVREVERHPGLALGDFAADPCCGVDGAAAASDDDPLAVEDPEAVISSRFLVKTCMVSAPRRTAVLAASMATYAEIHKKWMSDGKRCPLSADDAGDNPS